MGFRGGFTMSEKRYYTIKELTKEVNRTAATIYSFIRSSEEVKRFFYEHRKENTKGGYIYDEKVLELLKNQYLVGNAVAPDDFKTENNKIPNDSGPLPRENDDLTKELAALSAELEELKGKYVALQADFDKVEAERVELLRQNGQNSDSIKTLNILLAQEKKEKYDLQRQLDELKMLPPPQQQEEQPQTQEEQKKSGIINIIKGLFRKKD